MRPHHHSNFTTAHLLFSDPISNPPSPILETQLNFKCRDNITDRESQWGIFSPISDKLLKIFQYSLSKCEREKQACYASCRRRPFPTQLYQFTVQNLLKREWMRYLGVFLAGINFHFHYLLFGPKSRANPFKCFHQLKDIGQISRQLTRAGPKSDHFPRVAAPKAGKSRHPNF